MTNSLSVAKDVLAIEADAIRSLAVRLDHSFVDAVEHILKCKGRLVVTGIGKSGHIGRKIAATFASTGCPAFFVHAAEAGHGDLGMITSTDIVIAISNSGESEEVINLVVFARRFGAFIIGITGRLNSVLAANSDLVLDASVEKEACPLGVAPTSSTIVQLALGDALAMATLTARGFSMQDFAKTHPNGALGRRLFMRVKDVMKGLDEVPHMPSSAPLLNAIAEISQSRVGAVVVVDEADCLVGIFTDSDLRRLLVRIREDLSGLNDLTLLDVLTQNPRSIPIDHLASEALAVIETQKISRLVCMDGDRVAGLISLHDLIENKIT